MGRGVRYWGGRSKTLLCPCLLVKQLPTGARAADPDLTWHLKWAWSGIVTAAEIATGHALTHAGCLLQLLLLLSAAPY